VTDWDLLEKLNVNVALNYFGHRYNNPANTNKLKPYLRVNLASSYELSEDFRIFGSVNNLFDSHSELISGYNTPELSYYLGAKKTF